MKKRTTTTIQRLCLMLTLSALALTAEAQLQYALRFKSAESGASEQKAMTVDAQGNTYIGYNTQTFFLEKNDRSGSWNDPINKPSATNYRAAMLVKVDSTGNAVWNNMAYCSTTTNGYNAQITSVFADEKGFVYVSGFVANNQSPYTVNIFGQSINLTTAGTNNYDMYVAKLNASNGSLVWAKVFPCAATWDMGMKVMADAADNVYYLGGFAGTTDALALTLTLKSGGTKVLKSAGSNDLVAIKMNSDGEVLWGTTVGSQQNDNGVYDMALDASGNVFLSLTLNTSSTSLASASDAVRAVWIDGVQTGFLQTQVASSKESFIGKFNAADGSLLWGRLFGGKAHQDILKIAGDPAGDVYLNVRTTDSISIYDASMNRLVQLPATAGQTQGRILKMQGSDGALLWERLPVTGRNFEYSSLSFNNGMLCVAGQFADSIRLSSNVVLKGLNTTRWEGLLLGYSPNGELLLAEGLLGAENDYLKHVAINANWLSIIGTYESITKVPFANEYVGTIPNTDVTNRSLVALYRAKPSFTPSDTLRSKAQIDFNFQPVPSFLTKPLHLTYSIASGTLPNGWTLHPQTGVISGKATQASSGSFILKASNATDNNEAFARYVYAIETKPCEVLRITTDTVAVLSATINETLNITGVDGTVSWSALSPLPEGVQLASNGVLTGFPKNAGVYSFDVKVLEEGGCETSKTLVLAVESYNYSLSPAPIWNIKLAGSGWDQTKSIALDPQGNPILTAAYSDLTYGTFIAPNSGGKDAFILKLNGANGQLHWGNRIGGAGANHDQGQAVASNSNGTIVMTGIMMGKGLVGPLNSTDTIVTNGGRDIHISSFSSRGTRNWYRNYGVETAATYEAGLDIATDRDSNILVTGYTAPADFAVLMHDNSIQTLSGASGDIFLMKKNSAGKCLWAKRIGDATNGGENGFGVTTDAAGNIFLSGEINGSLNPVDFGNNKQISVVGTSLFVAKYDPNGLCLWVRAIGEAASRATSGRGKPIVADAQGNVYVAGILKGTSQLIGGTETVRFEGLSATETDGLLIKFSAQGEYLWSKLFQGQGNDALTTVAIDSADQVYAVGYFQSDMPIQQNIRFSSAGATRTVFVSKYQANGQFMNAFTVGGTGDACMALYGAGFAVDQRTRDMYLCGAHTGTIQLPGNSSVLENGGYYVAKFSQNAQITGQMPAAYKDSSYVTHLSIANFNTPGEVRFRVSAGNLPNGIVLDSVSGTLSGVPVSFGRNTFTLTASDGIASAERAFTITVSAANCALSVNNTFLDNAYNTQSYTAEFTASNANGNTVWQVNNAATTLPAGLSMTTEANKGILSGTVNVASADVGEFLFSVEVSDEAGCTASRAFSLNVEPAPTAAPQHKIAVKIYPNPVSSDLYIFAPVEGLLEAELYTVDGQKCFSQWVTGHQQQSISVRHLPQGHYFMVIRQNGKIIYSQAIVK